MPGIVVVGLQWGDEGKGKVVDLLSERASHVVRSQGGNNAGHTIIKEGEQWALHLIPSGVLHPQSQCYVAGGCLIDPKVLIHEMQSIESRGVEIVQRLHISPYAHIIFPFHRKLDELSEARRGDKAIGTTGRGIGPCVTDRSERIGLRIAELIRPDIFREKLERVIGLKNLVLEKVFNEPPIDFESVFGEYSAYGELLRPFVSDVEGRLQDALVRDETVLFEGAHGTLLDGIYGSYPFVTSSSTISSGVCAGAGVGPMQIDEIYGVLKAYTTRVGQGPLPTTVEADYLADFNAADELREMGTTTGRTRRIGWLDLPLARHAIGMNGVNRLILTKLDIFDDFSEIKVCTGYKLRGEIIDRPPPLVEDLACVEPIYEVLPGWLSKTSGVEKVRGLPKGARNYIDRIEDFCNVSVSMVSVGPGREQTIEIDEEWM